MRKVIYSGDTLEIIKLILDALVEGPKGDLMRTIPENTKIDALYITPDAMVVVDLSTDVREVFSGGAKTEILTVYSIVNSIILNMHVIN